jgi:rSAM/selenodomain-associated transferase 2
MPATSGIPLSIVMPVLDEAGGIVATLARLAPLRARGVEVVVVDGGSGDGTPVIAAAHADRVIVAPRGRALQMNAGAAAARGAVLLFLHADTLLPFDADRLIATALADGTHVWGRFDVSITGDARMLAVVASMMNLRSRLSGIATGDQAIFVTRDAFTRVGGFPAVDLMEDVRVSRALKRLSAPACLHARVATSGRRWERHGVWRTILLMWRLRFLHFVGVSPAVLARAYRGGR